MSWSARAVTRAGIAASPDATVRVAVLVACTALVAACGPSGPRRPSSRPAAAPLAVTSRSMQADERLAAPFACTDYDHLGHSPQLSWGEPPAGTTGFAVTVVDPDARGFVHWALLDLPASTRSLAEGASPGGGLPAGAHELKNGFGKPGYGGPCPPRGSTHHYVFTVWALRRSVSAVADLADAAVASGSLAVTFGR